MRPQSLFALGGTSLSMPTAWRATGTRPSLRLGRAVLRKLADALIRSPQSLLLRRFADGLELWIAADRIEVRLFIDHLAVCRFQLECLGKVPGARPLYPAKLK